MSQRKQLQQTLKWASARGWISTLTRANHYRLLRPGCPLVFTSSSPSKPSAIANLRAQIMRAERELVT